MNKSGECSKIQILACNFIRIIRGDIILVTGKSVVHLYYVNYQKIHNKTSELRERKMSKTKENDKSMIKSRFFMQKS